MTTTRQTRVKRANGFANKLIDLHLIGRTDGTEWLNGTGLVLVKSELARRGYHLRRLRTEANQIRYIASPGVVPGLAKATRRP